MSNDMQSANSSQKGGCDVLSNLPACDSYPSFADKLLQPVNESISSIISFINHVPQWAKSNALDTGNALVSRIFAIGDVFSGSDGSNIQFTQQNIDEVEKIIKNATLKASLLKYVSEVEALPSEARIEFVKDTFRQRFLSVG